MIPKCGALGTEGLSVDLVIGFIIFFDKRRENKGLFHIFLGQPLLGKQSLDNATL